MTLRSLLSAGADDAVAISAPGRPELDYAGLRAHCDQIGRQLAGQGLGPEDRVAIVLPNGPKWPVHSLRLRVSCQQPP